MKDFMPEKKFTISRETLEIMCYIPFIFVFTTVIGTEQKPSEFLLNDKKPYNL